MLCCGSSQPLGDNRLEIVHVPVRGDVRAGRSSPRPLHELPMKRSSGRMNSNISQTEHRSDSVMQEQVSFAKSGPTTTVFAPALQNWAIPQQPDPMAGTELDLDPGFDSASCSESNGTPVAATSGAGPSEDACIALCREILRSSSQSPRTPQSRSKPDRGLSGTKTCRNAPPRSGPNVRPRVSLFSPKPGCDADEKAPQNGTQSGRNAVFVPSANSSFAFSPTVVNPEKVERLKLDAELFTTVVRAQCYLNGTQQKLKQEKGVYTMSDSPINSGQDTGTNTCSMQSSRADLLNNVQFTNTPI